MSTGPARGAVQSKQAMALIPQGTDIVPLSRNEDSSAQASEVLRTFLTDDFD